MIEIYAFLAVFLVLILGMSVLYPMRLGRAIMTSLKRVPAERLAEFYPGVDVRQAHERFLTRYRAANIVVAVFGLVLLGWFLNYMKRPDWNEGIVGGLLTGYFFLQNTPTLLIAWFTTRFNKVHRRVAAEGKRKAVLQRRGLFDFVSPLTVALAVLSFLSFAAFMFYIARNPFPGFGGPFANIGILSVMYLVLGFFGYRLLYGKKLDPLQTHADRMRHIRVLANTIAWMCIIVPLVMSLTIARKVLDLQSWGPFVGGLVFLIYGLLSFRTLSAPPQEEDESGTTPARP